MPDTTTDDLAAATREAEDAQTRFLALEFAALHNAPDKRPSATEVLAQGQEAEHAAARVEITRKRLDEAREAARLASLETIGADLMRYADSNPAAALHDALQRVADAAEGYQAFVSQHDQAVADLNARAAALADAGGRTGPVLRARDGAAVRYGTTEVVRLGDRGRLALDAALRGDMARARGELVPVRNKTPPEPAAWYRDTVGQFGPMPVYGPRPDRSLADMISDGRAVPMSAEEVDRWRAGGQ